MNKVAEIIDLEFSEFNIEQNSESKISRLTTQFPLVSIVVPVYNGSKYIKAAIESIFEQTYSNYEVIVVDDGSTDNTREILKAYEEHIYYLYQANQGSASARNLGIKVAKGELIAFLDADDYWSIPKKLEKQVACFNDDPKLGCVNTGWRIVNEKNEHIKTVQPWHKAPELNLETWLKRKCVRTSAMIFRREWLEKVGGFDEELRQSHDVDLILRLSLAGCKTTWLKEDTVCYRQHEANTTRNSVRQAKYVQAVLDKFFAHQNLPEHIRETESQTRYHTLVWLAWYQYRANNLELMSELLQKSLDISPYLRVENIAHWITSFERFSKERGETFDAASLTLTLQWQQLLEHTLRLKTNKLNPQLNHSVIIDNRQKLTDRENNKFQLSQIIQKIETLERESINNAKQKPNNCIVNEKSPGDLCKLAETNISQGNINQGLTLYEKALESNPNSWDINLKLGKAWQKMSNLEKAIAYYSRAIELKPDRAELYWDLGQALFKQGKGKEGIEHYIYASQLKPNHHRFQSIVADMMQKIGKMEEAIAYYSRSIKLKPEEHWNYLKLGVVYEKLGQFDQSASNLSKAIEIKPDLAIAYKDLGQVREMQQRLDEATECYQKAIALQPDIGLGIYRTLGQVLQLQQSVKFES